MVKYKTFEKSIELIIQITISEFQRYLDVNFYKINIGRKDRYLLNPVSFVRLITPNNLHNT